MATSQDIQAAIAEAKGLAILAEDMVALLDRALAAAIAIGGSAEVASVTYTVAGRSRTLAIAEFRTLRQYYAGISGSAGGIAFVGLEFGG